MRRADAAPSPEPQAGRGASAGEVWRSRLRKLTLRGMRLDRLRTAARLILAVLFAGAGLLHLSAPAPFLLITPDWVPRPELVVFWTGVAELAGAAGLLHPRLRVAAGWALAAYAVAVFPANVKHALEGVAVPGLPSGWGYHGPRLALQPAIVLWCLWASGALDALKRRSRAPLAGGKHP